MDDADFSLKLLNQLSGPARKMAGDVRTLERELVKLDRAAASVRGPEALKRFDLSSQIRQARQAERFQSKITAAIVSDHRKRIKVRELEAKRQQKLAQDIRNARISGNQEFFDAAGSFALKASLASVAIAAAAAAAAVVALAAKFSDATFEALKFRQTSVLALTKLTESERTAQLQFDDLRHEVGGLGLDVKDTEKNFQKLLAAQFDIPIARDMIRMGADLRAIGASADQVSRALLAMTQIKSKGRLMAGEMLQLQEAGISAALVYKALGERLGKTTTELRKLQQQGKIDAAVGIEAIIDAVKLKTGVEVTGEAGRDFAKNTIEGQQASMKAAFTNIFVDIAAAVEPILVPLIGRVLSLFETIRDNPTVKALGTFLLNRFELFGLWVEANWPQIEGVIVSGVELIASAIRGAVDVVDFFGQNWDTVKTILTGVGVVLGILAIGAALTIAPFLLFGAAVLGVVGAIAFAIGWIIDHVGDWYDAGANLIGGLIDGIKSKIQAGIDAIKSFGGDVLEVFKRTTGIFSPSREFEKFGAFTVEGYVKGVSANDNAAMGATRDMAASAQAGIESQVLREPSLTSDAIGSFSTVDGPGATTEFAVNFGDVHIHGSDNPDDQAEQFMEAVTPRIRRVIREELKAS